MTQMSPTATATLTVAVAVPGLYSMFLPSLAALGGTDRQQLRIGQAKAGAVSLVLGAAGSALSRSPWPVLATLAMVVFVCWQYECQHNRGPND